MEMEWRDIDCYALFSKASKPVDMMRHDCPLPQPFPEMIAAFVLGSWTDCVPEQLKAVIIDKKNSKKVVQIGTLTKENRAFCWQPSQTDNFVVPRGKHHFELLITRETHASNMALDSKTTKGKGSKHKQEDINEEDGSMMECSQTESQEVMSCDLLPEEDRDVLSESPGSSTKSYFNKLLRSEKTPEVQHTPTRPPQLSHSASKKRKGKHGDDEDGGTPRSLRRRQSARRRSSLSSPSSSSRTDGPENKKTAGDNKMGQTPSFKKEIDDSVPSPRWGHTLCEIDEGRGLLIGGQGHKQVLSRDSIWELNTETGEWNVPPITTDSNKPQYRMGHTATYDPKAKCVYVHGGSKNLRWFSDIHVLDVESWKWSLVKANGLAPTRAYHSSNIFRNELYIFGGVFPNPDPQPDGCSNDVFIYNPESESWYQPVTMGIKPKPRSGHSATLLNDQLVIFGGWDAPVCFNDLHILDLCLMEFTSPKVTGRPPSPRSWHASVALPGNRVLIHGGYNGNNALEDAFIFNLDTYTWTPADLKSSIPIGIKAGHTVINLHGNITKEEENKENNAKPDYPLAIFGGGDNEDNFFSDLTPFKVLKS